MNAELKRNLGRSYFTQSANPSDLSGAVSKSLLWNFHKSPYKWFNDPNPFKSTASMDLGRLIHCLVLTPDDLNTDFSVSPFDSFRTNDARKWKEDAELAGKTVITIQTLEEATAASKAFLSTPEINHLNKYETEVAAFASIGATRVKGMIDIVPKTGTDLWDLKTTATIQSADELVRMIINRGYHWQAALYLDLWNAATSESRDGFVFAFMETAAPYETAFVRLSSELIDLGRSGTQCGRHQGYMQAIFKWQECVSRNHWPKMVEGIHTAELPKWILP